ncbi:unnamed protein product [Amoebophrya sp. A25]|nr:unnamed protein product [Amoebophrya sp. A25]|eukprot:GSA25T00009836001.1
MRDADGLAETAPLLDGDASGVEEAEGEHTDAHEIVKQIGALAKATEFGDAPLSTPRTDAEADTRQERDGDEMSVSDVNNWRGLNSEGISPATCSCCQNIKVIEIVRSCPCATARIICSVRRCVPDTVFDRVVLRLHACYCPCYHLS